MDRLNALLQELGITKVKLSKYLGVSRQMVYNYLMHDTLDTWPSDKRIKLLELLEIESIDDINNIEFNKDYYRKINEKFENISKNYTNNSLDLKGLKKGESELVYNIFYLLKDLLIDDETTDTMNTLKYLYHFLQSVENVKELKYILAYFSKNNGFINADEYVFNKQEQYILETVIFSGLTLYYNGGVSEQKLNKTHKIWEDELEHKKEERLGRTQELHFAHVQALRELGTDSVNEGNYQEVLSKISEIMARKETIN